MKEMIITWEVWEKVLETNEEGEEIEKEELTQKVKVIKLDSIARMKTGWSTSILFIDGTKFEVSEATQISFR